MPRSIKKGPFVDPKLIRKIQAINDKGKKKAKPEADGQAENKAKEKADSGKKAKEDGASEIGQEES